MKVDAKVIAAAVLGAGALYFFLSRRGEEEEEITGYTTEFVPSEPAQTSRAPVTTKTSAPAPTKQISTSQFIPSSITTKISTATATKPVSTSSTAMSRPVGGIPDFGYLQS